MPRIRRSQLPDGYFHVTARGVASEHVFLDDDDRREFLELLARAIDRFGWRCHAFCLLGTHYHLILETTRERLSEGVQWLNGVYAQRFNRHRRRTGHLFGARFSSWVIHDEKHFRAAVDYVLANPVRAGLVAAVDDWPWSGTPRRASRSNGSAASSRGRADWKRGSSHPRCSGSSRSASRR